MKKSAIDELRNRVLAALEDGSISDLKFFGQNTPEASAIMTELSKSKHLSKVGEDNRQRYLAARELAQIASDVKPEHGPRIWNLLDQFFIPYLSRTRAVIDVKSVIIPERMAAAGLLVKSTTVVWEAIVRKLGADWNAAYSIPPSIWEEIIAGAFNKAGFDEVVLTPRSGDYGRDVIAIKHGVGCIKIIGSVKAYKPDHLVKHDDVRALLGVMSGESNTSKGLITTTSNFAPRIPTDPFIKPFLPTRLQLVNGQRLRGWLTDLAEKSEKAAR